MAKPGTRTRKKVKKTIVDGVAHVHASFNNTIVTISDRQGNVLSWASSGNVGFKDKRDRQFSAIVELALEYAKPVRIGNGAHARKVNLSRVGAGTDDDHDHGPDDDGAPRTFSRGAVVVRSCVTAGSHPPLG